MIYSYIHKMHIIALTTINAVNLMLLPGQN